MFCAKNNNFNILMFSYRNSTRCYKYSIQITVLNNSTGLCFNEKYHLKQTLFPRGPSWIVCHQVNDFGQEVDYPSIQWYKVHVLKFPLLYFF